MNHEIPQHLFPKVQNSEVLWNNFLRIQKDHLKHSNGLEQDYFVLNTHNDAVIILGITDNNEYVLNKEYRHPCQKALLCCPGGFLEKGEDSLTGAAREFEEETGYQAESFELIGKAYPYPGICSQLLYFVRANHARKVMEPHPEETELLRTLLVKPQDLRQMIQEGVDLDGILCSMLFFASLK